MAENIMASKDYGFKSIREIVEKIESIVATVNEFRGDINDLYDKFDLAFLKRISKSLVELEKASNEVILNFAEIEETFEDYNKQEEVFSKQYRLRRA